MSLILMCGLPASGKTAIADKLRHLFEADGRTVRLIRDGDAAITPSSTSHALATPASQPSLQAVESTQEPIQEPTDAETVNIPKRPMLYRDSTTEKQTRAQLRANAERALSSSDTIVIVDSLNYIKGYRYELYCVAKTAGVSYAVIHAEATPAVCQARDDARAQTDTDAYGEAVLLPLTRRFEAPNARNRWDSPLFTVNVSTEQWEASVVTEVYASLKAGKRLSATMATRQFCAPQVDVLGEIDRVTRGAEAALIARVQGGTSVGDVFLLPGASVKLRLERKPRIAELRNMRRAYLNFSRLHPPKSDATHAFLDEYVQYVNEQLRKR